MYIYNDDGTRTDAMYDSSKDIYLGKINEVTLADGTKTISLTGTSSSVIVGKEYTVENFWDVLTELNDTLTTKIDISNLKSRMKSGELKIGILGGSQECAILVNIILSFLSFGGKSTPRHKFAICSRSNTTLRISVHSNNTSTKVLLYALRHCRHSKGSR